MNEPEKSDSAIVAVKPANKAGPPAAEWVEPRAGTCVQRRLACSAGGSPAGVAVRSPVARIAERREIDDLKPIDKPS